MQPPERVEGGFGRGSPGLSARTVCRKRRGNGRPSKSDYRGIELHLIGPLQTNKTRAAMELFDAIHTVDRSKLVQAIARIAGETGRCPDLFVQVNTGDEGQKAGVSVEEVDALVAECRAAGLPLVGLMCIPPIDEPPSLHFALLAKIAKRNGLANLSMGMSGDVEEAIAQGATHVRVGSAVFGARDYG